MFGMSYDAGCVDGIEHGMFELSHDKLSADNESETHSAGFPDELQSVPQYFAMDQRDVPAYADVWPDKRACKSRVYRMSPDTRRVYGVEHDMFKLSYCRLPAHDSAESRDCGVPDELHPVSQHEPVAGGDL